MNVFWKNHSTVFEHIGYIYISCATLLSTPRLFIIFHIGDKKTPLANNNYIEEYDLNT